MRSICGPVSMVSASSPTLCADTGGHQFVVAVNTLTSTPCAASARGACAVPIPWRVQEGDAADQGREAIRRPANRWSGCGGLLHRHRATTRRPCSFSSSSLPHPRQATLVQRHVLRPVLAHGAAHRQHFFHAPLQISS